MISKEKMEDLAQMMANKDGINYTMLSNPEGGVSVLKSSYVASVKGQLYLKGFEFVKEFKPKN
jgi:hypothetical protein